jgi:hypothetical protein
MISVKSYIIHTFSSFNYTEKPETNKSMSNGKQPLLRRCTEEVGQRFDKANRKSDKRIALKSAIHS